MSKPSLCPTNKAPTIRWAVLLLALWVQGCAPFGAAQNSTVWEPWQYESVPREGIVVKVLYTAVVSDEWCAVLFTATDIQRGQKVSVSDTFLNSTNAGMGAITDLRKEAAGTLYLGTFQGIGKEAAGLQLNPYVKAEDGRQGRGGWWVQLANRRSSAGSTSYAEGWSNKEGAMQLGTDGPWVAITQAYVRASSETSQSVWVALTTAPSKEAAKKGEGDTAYFEVGAEGAREMFESEFQVRVRSAQKL